MEVLSTPFFPVTIEKSFTIADSIGQLLCGQLLFFNRLHRERRKQVQSSSDDKMRRSMIYAVIALQVQSDVNAMAGLRLALEKSISVCFIQNLNHYRLIYLILLSKEGG